MMSAVATSVVARRGRELAREAPDEEQDDRHRCREDRSPGRSAARTSPTDSVKATKTRLPPRIHQLGRRLSSPWTASQPRRSRSATFRRAAGARAGCILTRPCSTTPSYREHRNDQRDAVDQRVDLGLALLRQRVGAVEQEHVAERDQREAADDRDPAERLHRGVHGLARGLVVGPAGRVDARHRLDGHRVGDRVLDHVAGRREQRRDHEPAPRRSSPRASPRSAR